jgi:uncharacterized membrane protein YgcG
MIRILDQRNRVSTEQLRRVGIMVRHLSRLAISLVAVIGLLMLASSQAKAQGLFGADPSAFMNDPFSFYYAVYLPNQQLQALRPNPLDTINSADQVRQYYAHADRRDLYNPISPYSEGNYDPLRPYSQQNTERRARPYRFAQHVSNSRGMGPSLYYNRAAAYFPGLRPGTGQNANVYSGHGSGAPRSGRSGGGGMGGMGGMGGGMGGGGMGGGGMGGMGMM